MYMYVSQDILAQSRDHDFFCHRFGSYGRGLGNAAVAVPVYTKGSTVMTTFDTILFALAKATYCI